MSKQIADLLPLSVGAVRPTQGKTLAVMHLAGATRAGTGQDCIYWSAIAERQAPQAISCLEGGSPKYRRQLACVPLHPDGSSIAATQWCSDTDSVGKSAQVEPVRISFHTARRAIVRVLRCGWTAPLCD